MQHQPGLTFHCFMFPILIVLLILSVVKPTSEIFDIPYYKRYPSYYELALISDFKSVVSCSGT